MLNTSKLEQALGYTFKDKSLLLEALTHTSQVKLCGVSYERLEFLGDRVLGLIIADMLMTVNKGDEGELTRQYTNLVRHETLAHVAEFFKLGDYLFVGLKDEHVRYNKVALADALEAIIAALFKDGGYKVAETFVLHWFMPLMLARGKAPKDAKTELQEWFQGHGMLAPVYKVVRESGPEHAKEFVVHVSTTSPVSCVEGRGRTKKAAEMCAAMRALRLINGL